MMRGVFQKVPMSPLREANASVHLIVIFLHDKAKPSVRRGRKAAGLLN
jgi:hypothetical protein